MTWIVTIHADVRYHCPVDGQATASEVGIRLNGTVFFGADRGHQHGVLPGPGHRSARAPARPDGAAIGTAVQHEIARADRR
jgi:hypothetical protein